MSKFNIVRDGGWVMVFWNGLTVLQIPRPEWSDEQVLASAKVALASFGVSSQDREEMILKLIEIKTQSEDHNEHFDSDGYERKIRSLTDAQVEQNYVEAMEYLEFVERS